MSKTKTIAVCNRPSTRHSSQSNATPNDLPSILKDDGLCWDGLHEPTPLRDIDRVERQNTKLAINVFGWDKGLYPLTQDIQIRGTHHDRPSISHKER